MTAILDEIKAERERQKSLTTGTQTFDDFDKTNSQGDWVSYITAYAGRAPQKVVRNVKENQTFRANMIKVAAIAIAAIESHDKGYC